MIAMLLLNGAEASPDTFEKARREMVQRHIQQRGIRDPAVVRAMLEVPRHLFVPESIREHSYADQPLPLGHGQTISQPYIVAAMSEMLRPARHLRVLEIGTGSGYQAAVLAKLFRHVYSIEIVPALAKLAEANLRAAGVTNVTVRVGDGYLGWPELAPFDRILLTAAPPEVPAALIEQLARGGRLVAPEGADTDAQYLVTIDKDSVGNLHRRIGDAVRFVPMVPGRGGR